MSPSDFFQELLRPHPAESAWSVWTQEEARAERMAGLIRIGYMVMWLAVTAATTDVNGEVANRVNLGVGGAWFAGAVLYFAYLRAKPYRPSFKYASLTVDIALAALMLFLYHYDPVGPAATLKSPAFMNFYLLLVLAALRFHVGLPVYGGVLAAGLFLLMVAFFVGRGMTFGSRQEMYLTDKVNLTYLVFDVLYLGLFTAVLAVFVGNVRRLVGLRAHEAQRAVMERGKRRRTLSTLERYFTPQVARHILLNPQELGGRVQEATILIGDVRNFTRLSESLGPTRTMEFLNGFFELMVEIVFRHGGTLDKFLGDGMLVAFGVPRVKADDALRAVRAAAEMAQAARAFEGGVELQLGFAVHTGDVLMGNVGSRTRMEFTVIGDVVNTACRMEPLNKVFGTTIIVSGATYERVKDRVSARLLPETELRGKEGLVRLYEFTGWREP